MGGVTPIGAVLFVLAAWYFVARPRRLAQGIMFFASFSGTSVFNFGAFGLSPVIVFLAFLLLRFVLAGDLPRRVPVGRNHLAVLLALLAFTGFCAFSLLLNGGMRGIVSLQVTQLIYLLFGTFLALLLSVEWARPERLDDAVRALRAAAVFIALWGVLQATCFYAGLPYPAFVFNNSTSHFADMYSQEAGSGITRIASVATEPSFMASSLMYFGAFGATLVACENRLRTRGWVAAVGLVLVVVAASTSTTGFFGLAVLALLLALRRPGVVLLATLGALAAATVGLFLSPGFRNALYVFTLGKASTSSYSDRSASLVHALGRFAEQPWFGWGWGSDFSYSILTSLLANTGLIGSLLFLVAFTGTILASRSARHVAGSLQAGPSASVDRLRAYALGAENAMLVSIAQMAVSGFKYVVPDFWCFWALSLAVPSCLLATARTSERTPGRTSGLTLGHPSSRAAPAAITAATPGASA